MPDHGRGEIMQAVERLVEAYHPEAVYLFGSCARGQAGPDSDYDLLVVVDDGAGEERRRAGRAYEALRPLGRAFDVVIWRRTPYEAALKSATSLPATIAREGILLYGHSLLSKTDSSRRAQGRQNAARSNIE